MHGDDEMMGLGEEYDQLPPDDQPQDMNRAYTAIGRFAGAMRNEMYANRYKGDWHQLDRLSCLQELLHHSGKLAGALAANERSAVREFAADVGNIAMFIYELFGTDCQGGAE